MTLEMLYNEKLHEGLREGHREGALEKAEQIALSMLTASEISLDKIAEYTGLSKEHVEALKAQLEETNSKQ